MPDRTAHTLGDSEFHGYLARNLSDAYRLAIIALDDPIVAQAVVHDAFIYVWMSANAGSEPDLDDALRRRLDAATAAAIRWAGPATAGSDAGPLEAAIA